MRSKKKFHCADCGNHKAVTKVTEGRVCLPCLTKRNRRLDELALTNAIVAPVDPDGPPVPCGCRGCRQYATFVTRVPDAKHGVVGVAGCQVEMTQTVAKVLAGTAGTQ